MAIPNVEDYIKLTQKIWPSFEIPKARCEALKVTNDYSALPALKCIGRKLVLDSGLPCQDYHPAATQKTLAYAQALQYWVEKANPPSPGKLHQLAECIQELREAMKPFTTFHNHDILGKEIASQETLAVEVEEAVQPGTPPTRQLTALVA